MLFIIGVFVFENVGGDYELVKNDIRRYSNVWNIQWFDWTVLLCISVGLQQNVSKSHKTSGSTLC